MSAVSRVLYIRVQYMKSRFQYFLSYSFLGGDIYIGRASSDEVGGWGNRWEPPFSLV